MESKQIMDRNFGLAFSRFNSDVVDWSNPHYFREVTPYLVSDIAKYVKDLNLLIIELTQILDEWTPDLILKFVNSTDIDWYDSDEDERVKEIITILVKEIGNYQKAMAEYEQRIR
jgi:hypothetical protein